MLKTNKYFQKVKYSSKNRKPNSSVKALNAVRENCTEKQQKYKTQKVIKKSNSECFLSFIYMEDKN